MINIGIFLLTYSMLFVVWSLWLKRESYEQDMKMCILSKSYVCVNTDISASSAVVCCYNIVYELLVASAFSLKSLIKLISFICIAQNHKFASKGLNLYSIWHHSKLKDGVVCPV